MSSYGRNFEFRVPPAPNQRGARYVTPADAVIPIGAPVEVTDTTTDGNERNEVALAAGVTPKRPGLTGILVYEHSASAFAGTDALLTTFSDLGDAPAASPVQLVSGTEIKVVLRNTADRSFYGQRDYAGRVMVGPADLTGIEVGSFLAPAAAPDDTVGYWAETITEADAWLVVTNVDTVRGEVEARMTF